MVYKDMTFCINKECTNRCSKFLTCEIEAKAKSFGIPLAVSSFICIDVGEGNNNEKMS